MLVLDTHAWIWLADDPARLSDSAREAIAGTERFGVATISCWEIGMLAVKGRIALAPDTRTWVRRSLAMPGLEALPLVPSVALEASELDDAVGEDPADRMIYATARAHGATLITRDRRLRAFDPRGTLW